MKWAKIKKIKTYVGKDVEKQAFSWGESLHWFNPCEGN